MSVWSVRDGATQPKGNTVELTFIGAAQFLIGGLLLLAGSTVAMFAYVLACGLMGGSAAMLLPALGGSSIPPIQFALVFLVARIVMPGGSGSAMFAPAFRANIFYVAFVAYAVAAATLAPRIFKGDMEVPPLRFRGSKYIFDTVSLAPSSQNLTTSIYLVGGLLLALCTYIVCCNRQAPKVFVTTGIAISWVHVTLGLIGVAIPGSALLTAFRNANYAQLDNSYRSFIRINGIFPEASGYAVYAFVWFVFMVECWYRGVRSRATGLTALALGAVLVFSTSSSAYVGLGAYGALFVLRVLFVPQAARGGKLLVVAAAGLCGVILAAGFAVARPDFAAEFGDMLSRMTVEKSDSYSGLQRAFWARKGIEAFFVSSGLGIGPGSFRSSSLFAAILGSAGIIGIVTFLGHVARVFQPLRLSTYAPVADERMVIGAAASWAVIALLILAGIAAPSPDPGGDFAIFTGAALALRGFRLAAPSQQIPAASVFHPGGIPPPPTTGTLNR